MVRSFIGKSVTLLFLLLTLPIAILIALFDYNNGKTFKENITCILGYNVK